MSEARRDTEYLGDIVQAMRRIIVYTEGMSYEQFMADTRTQDAVLRNIEVIGEAIKKLSGDLKASHPHLPWSNMARMRDKVIHHYFSINYDIVWTVVAQEIPSLLPQIEDIYRRQTA